MKRRKELLGLVTVLAAICGAGMGADTYWQRDPATPGNWSDANDWHNGEPNATDIAYVNNGGTVRVTEPNEVCEYLHVGSGAGTSGTVELISGSLTVGPSGTSPTAFVGNDGGTGVFTQTGGTHTVHPFFSIGAGWDSGASGTYNLSGGTHTVGEISLGGSRNTTGAYNLSGTGRLEANSEYVGGDGTGTFLQTGGTNVVGDYLGVRRGSYILSGAGSVLTTHQLAIRSFDTSTAFIQNDGTVSADWIYVAGGGISSFRGRYEIYGGELSAELMFVGMGWGSKGVFIQDGGSVTVTDRLRLTAGDHSEGTYELRSGQLSAKTLWVGGALYATSTFTQTGGTNTVSASLEIGLAINSESTYTLLGGVINGDANMIVRRTGYSSTQGLLQGWGTVDLTGTLTHNGWVIADGEGVERTLDMADFAGVANTTENETDYGWFARNRGKLVLPAISVGVGGSTHNWGESPYGAGAGQDEEIDLVNSAQVAVRDVPAAGQLEISLLAADHGDAHMPGWLTAIGVWDFTDSNIAPSGATVTFRYDDALATSLSIAEQDIRLFQYLSGHWQQVSASLDDGNHWITGDVDSLSLFAVGVPEPATLSLLVLGGVALLRRRRA